MSEMHSEVLVEGTTRGMSVGDDFDYYSEAVAPVFFGIQPTRTDSERFEADFAVYRIGALGAARISVPATTAVRDRHLLDREPDDSFVLNLASSSSRVVLGGRTVVVPAMRLALMDCAVEGRVEFDPTRRLALRSLRIPRSSLPRTAADPARAIEALRRGPGEAFITAQLALFWEVLGRGGLRAAAEMTSVLSVLLETLGDGYASPASRLDVYRSAARTRISDPDYGVAVLARQLAVSPRTVQLAFAAHGEQFHDWLSAERLELALGLLRDPEWSGRSIEQIARRCGYRDVTTFHRAFRRRFGTTPGRMR